MFISTGTSWSSLYQFLPTCFRCTVACCGWRVSRIATCVLWRASPRSPARTTSRKMSPPLPSSPPRQVNIILHQTGKFVAAKFSHLLLLWCTYHSRKPPDSLLVHKFSGRTVNTGNHLHLKVFLSVSVVEPESVKKLRLRAVAVVAK